MKATAMMCPNCGSPVDAQNKFCPQCGTPIVIDDNAHKLQYTYQKVDDARIREADVRETVRLKELELELFKLKNHAQQKRTSLLVRLGVVFLLLFTMGILLLVSASNHSMRETSTGFSFFIIVNRDLSFSIRS